MPKSPVSLEVSAKLSVRTPEPSALRSTEVQSETM